MFKNLTSCQPSRLAQGMMRTAPECAESFPSPLDRVAAPVSLSDSDLVQRTRAGDALAFSQLVRRHERVIYNLAYRFMRDATLAEDMAQEAFLKAYRFLHGFRGDCSFATWLCRVTCSVCLTEIKRRNRRAEVELASDNARKAATEPHEVTDIPELVRRCVTKLPKRYAAIVTLYYLQELPYEEIAKTMRIPMGTLKTWMHRARLELRKIVEAEMSAPALQHDSDSGLTCSLGTCNSTA